MKNPLFAAVLGAAVALSPEIAIADTPVAIYIEIRADNPVHIDIDGKYTCDSGNNAQIGFYSCRFFTACDPKDSDDKSHCVVAALDSNKHHLTATTQGQQADIDFQPKLQTAEESDTHQPRYFGLCQVVLNDWMRQVMC